MRTKRLLCNIVGLLPPAAASFYLALRINITIMVFFAGTVPETVSEEYALRMLDTVSMIVLMTAWLALTIWLQYRVSGAKTCLGGLRAAAQHLGITLVAFGVTDALFRVALPTIGLGPVSLLIAAVSWVGGIALIWFGYQGSGRRRGFRPDRNSKD